MNTIRSSLYRRTSHEGTTLTLKSNSSGHKFTISYLTPQNLISAYQNADLISQ